MRPYLEAITLTLAIVVCMTLSRFGHVLLGVAAFVALLWGGGILADALTRKKKPDA